MARGPDHTIDAGLVERHGVTRREAEVLAALAGRLTNAEIAEQLYVSERTVESHVSSLLRKLAVDNRHELGRIATEHLRPTTTDPAPVPPALLLTTQRGECLGRDKERAVLTEAWKQAVDGMVRVVILSGDAGIGKTRLAAELAVAAAGEGATVITGSCFEDLAIPYGPFTEALTQLLSPDADSRLHQWGVSKHRQALSAIVSELTEDRSDPVVDEVDRLDVVTAVHDVLIARARRGPVVVLVEDLHWASTSSRDVLRHIARATSNVPLLVVVTSRTTAPDADDELHRFLGELRRLPATTHVPLDGLGLDEVRLLVERHGRDLDPADVLTRTGGNPLFLTELVASGQPTSPANLVARRRALLSEPDRHLLDVAAVVGLRFRPEVLADVDGWEVMEVLQALERAEAAGLVRSTVDGRHLFEHHHALFRDAAYDALTPSDRLRLHAAIADALDRRPDLATAAELAHHACLAAPINGARRALEATARATTLAERSGAIAEAVTLLRRADEAAALLDPPDPDTRLRIRIDLGRALNRMGDLAHRRLLIEAAGLARELEQFDAAAEIVWAMSEEGTPYRPGSVDDELQSLAADVLAHVPAHSPERARTLAASAEDLWLGGERVEGRRRAEEAMEIARRLGDDVLVAEVLIHSRTARWIPGSASSRAMARRILDIGRRSENRLIECHGLADRARISLESGDRDAMARALEAFGDAIERTTIPKSYLLGVLIGLRLTDAVLSGDLDRARAGVGELTDHVTERGRGQSTMIGPAQLVIDHLEGRVGERVDRLEMFHELGLVGFHQLSRGLLALALAHAGQPEKARRALAGLLGDDDGSGPNVFWLAGRVAAAEAAWVTNDAVAADQLAVELRPLAGVMATFLHGAQGPVDLARAQAAITLDRHDEAATIAHELGEHCDRQKMPIYRARSQLIEAAARRALGSPAGEVDRLVAGALAVADTTGATLIDQDAIALGLVD